jgi:VanZ family protein
MDENQTARALLVVVVIALMAAGLSPHPLPQVFAQQDKLHHLLGFAAMAWAFKRAFPRTRGLLVLGLGTGAALLIELAQLWVPTRTASVLDFAAGIAGVGIGWLAAQRSRPVARAQADADAAGTASCSQWRGTPESSEKM